MPAGVSGFEQSEDSASPHPLAANSGMLIRAAPAPTALSTMPVVIRGVLKCSSEAASSFGGSSDLLGDATAGMYTKHHPVGARHGTQTGQTAAG